NGVTVCTYNYTMGSCKWEMTPQGCCFTCTSGDAKCCAMIQSYCDCLNAMLSAGCHCCWFVNNTPLCWGCSETVPAKTSGKRWAEKPPPPQPPPRSGEGEKTFCPPSPLRGGGRGEGSRTRLAPPGLFCGLSRPFRWRTPCGHRLRLRSH